MTIAWPARSTDGEVLDLAAAAPTLAPVKTKPKVTVTDVTDEEVLAEVRAWEATHPGYDRTNFVDYFRNESGELIETDEFFRACSMYAFSKTAEIAE